MCEVVMVVLFCHLTVLHVQRRSRLRVGDEHGMTYVHDGKALNAPAIDLDVILHRGGRCTQ